MSSHHPGAREIVGFDVNVGDSGCDGLSVIYVRSVSGTDHIAYDEEEQDEE